MGRSGADPASRRKYTGNIPSGYDFGASRNLFYDPHSLSSSPNVPRNDPYNTRE